MRLCYRPLTQTLTAMSRHFSILGVLVLTCCSLLSCRGLPAGPSLSDIVLTNISLAPTTANAGLCCCRVEATVRNNNRIPVHVTIKYSALDGVDPEPIATILAFVPDLRPGSSRPVEAAGFIFPCVAIRDLATEVDVTGIAFPPT